MTFAPSRLNRAAYWLSLLIATLCLFLLDTTVKRPAPIDQFLFVLICIPRLHDIGRSGWWAGAVVLAELLLLVVVTAVSPHGNVAVGLALSVVLVGLLVWLGCIRGAPAENRYGKPPAPGLGLGAKRPTTGDGAGASP